MRNTDSRNTVTHRRLIERWVNSHPGWQTRGFKDAAWAALVEFDGDDENIYWSDWFDPTTGGLEPEHLSELGEDLKKNLRAIIPDAYIVYPENRMLFMYEAVNGHKISSEKRERLVSLFNCLDAIGWDFHIRAEWADGFEADVNGAKMFYADIEFGDELVAAARARKGSRAEPAQSERKIHLSPFSLS